MDQGKENKEDIDLSGVLKDSDTGVKFQEDRVEYSYFSGTPKVIRWLIKYSGGLIKNENQAAYVLIGFVVLAIIISLFLFLGGEKSVKFEVPPLQTPSMP